MHTAAEGKHGATLRQRDVQRDWRGLGGELLGDDAVRNFLERGIFVGGVAFEETVEQFGIEVITTSQDRVSLGSAIELGVVRLRDGTPVINRELLAAGIKTEDGLLRLELAKLDAGILARRRVQLAVTDGVAKGVTGFFLIACRQPRIRLIEQGDGALRVTLLLARHE